MTQKTIHFLRYLKNGRLNPLDSFKMAFTLSYRSSPLRIRPKYFGTDVFIRGGKSSDVHVFNQICIFKEYHLDFGFIPQIIVDAGANCGISSLFFATRYPNAKVFAIEPAQENYEALCQNTQGYPQITTCKSGLHHKTCLLTIENPKSKQEWAFKTRECKTGESGFQAITIPEIMNRLGTQSIDVLKLDIEGAELELFERNYKEWINHVNVIIVELHDFLRLGCSRAFFKAIISIEDFSLSVSGESLIIKRNRLITSK